MQCPYCNHEMEKGSLIGNHSQIRFVPNYKELEKKMVARRCKNCHHCLRDCDKIFEDILSKNGFPLGKFPKVGRPCAPNVYRCRSCKTFIVDIPPV